MGQISDRPEAVGLNNWTDKTEEIELPDNEKNTP